MNTSSQSSVRVHRQVWTRHLTNSLQQYDPSTNIQHPGSLRNANKRVKGGHRIRLLSQVEKLI